MKNAKLILYVLLLNCVIGLSSCITYKEVEVEEIKSINFKDGDISSGKIVATLKIKNPNNYKIRVKSYDLNAFLDGSDMGKVQVEESIVISKNSLEDYTLTFKPDLSKIMGVLPSLFFKGSADAAIKGKVKVKAMIFSKSFDVDLKKRVSASDLQ